MRNKVLENKSFSFAIRIVRFCTYIRQEKKEFVLSKQILKTRTKCYAGIGNRDLTGAMDGCHGLPIQKVMRHLAVELELVAKNSRPAFA